MRQKKPQTAHIGQHRSTLAHTGPLQAQLTCDIAALPVPPAPTRRSPGTSQHSLSNPLAPPRAPPALPNTPPARMKHRLPQWVSTLLTRIRG